MSDTNELLRGIPQVEKLMQDTDIALLIPEIGKGLAADIIREKVEKYRSSIIGGAAPDNSELKKNIITGIKIKISEKLQRIINGTGVIIHTNFGRAPLGEKIFETLKSEISGYCNLEFHIPSKGRGRRGGFAEELICRLTGSEDALIVNNNAASVFLILKQFADGREAVVSRGELIQIGGGFRIPDIMKESGAVLVETGTTNITTIEDYKNAITENTSMIFSAHTSNYKIEGFSEAPTMKELASLKSDKILYVRDLGSGNIFSPDKEGEKFEQTVYAEVAQGPDLVCFSGDKLLGGCQAGIIVGSKDLIGKLRKNPLMRMIRVDKITYMILQETLLEYVNGNQIDVELWKMIMQKPVDVMRNVNQFIDMMKNRSGDSCCIVRPTRATYGGGSMPGVELESTGVEIAVPGMKPDEINDYFLSCTPPIAGTVRDDRYVIDFYTVFERDIECIADAAEILIKNRL
ncbi:MAG: L-seryl-tRNA(Sec) selenium transferase [Spirochaetae bacterium HGW-Spirochaetae-5]|nr:MAG: L-seryl-tRNA(Sec) selenium transferase [Spirochaetae bacterium HGW-Spirochaetae-5]